MYIYKPSARKIGICIRRQNNAKKFLICTFTKIVPRKFKCVRVKTNAKETVCTLK